MKTALLLIALLTVGCAVYGEGYGVKLGWVMGQAQMRCDEDGAGSDCVKGGALSNTGAAAVGSIVEAAHDGSADPPGPETP